MTSDHGQLVAGLTLYERGHLRYTRCICRGIEVLVTGQPEELVRQALLHHLTRQSGLYPEVVDLRAEFHDLDIAVLKPPADECFRPISRPLVIIEVKRPEANLRDHEAQLFNYLIAHGTEDGVLYNGRELIAYRPDGTGGWAGEQLGSLDGLDELLRAAASRPDPDLDTFRRAASGCTTSFLALAAKYGRYTLHQVTFTLRGSPGSITGCCLRVEGDRVHYDLYGNYARKQKFAFRMSDFDRLLSVIY